MSKPLTATLFIHAEPNNRNLLRFQVASTEQPYFEKGKEIYADRIDFVAAEPSLKVILADSLFYAVGKRGAISIHLRTPWTAERLQKAVDCLTGIIGIPDNAISIVNLTALKLRTIK